MDALDPLFISDETVISRTHSVTPNRKGRPPKDTVNTFSTPPKSMIITKLLKEKVANPVALDLEPESISQFDQEYLGTQKNKRSTKVLNHSKIREYKCDFPECKYSCKLGSNVLKHKRTHNEEKPYACDECPFQTKFINSLKVHKRLHTGDRPYICEYCTYRCNSISNLKKHLHHIHTDSSTSK